MADTDIVDTPQTGDVNIEARARAQGWRPKEEFKGPPERWRPADEYLKVADEFMPVAIDRNRKLEKNVHELKSELGEVKQVLSEFRDFASRGEQRAYERAKAELMAKREVAVAHADSETFKQVDREIAELEKTVPKPAPKPENAAAKPTVVPEITSWIAENPWFNSDRVLHNLAKGLDEDLQNLRPGLDVADRLAAVKAEVQRRYPEKFENPNRDGATSVSQPSGGGGSRRPEKRSYENLPPEAKKACDKFVKTIPKFTREDYVKDYAWPE